MGSHLCQLWSSIRSEHPLWKDVTRDMIPWVYIPPSSFPGSLNWTFSFLFSSLSCVVSTHTLERSLSLDFTALETFCACSSSTCIFIHVWVSKTCPALRAFVLCPCLYSVLSERQTSLVLCMWSLASSCFQELISNCKGEKKKLLWIFCS